MVLREARTPTAGSGNEQATEVMLELAKAQAQAALDKMYDPKKVALADKLESQNGINCFRKNQDAHEKTIGCDGTNDDVENKFAIGDWVFRCAHAQLELPAAASTTSSLRPMHLLLLAGCAHRRLLAPSVAGRTATSVCSTRPASCSSALPTTLVGR